MRLLDLFCGAGGAALGYANALSSAGVEYSVVGIDIEPQRHYPFTFIQADALRPPLDLRSFDLIHASPPCQVFTQFVRAGLAGPTNHEDLLDDTRALLEASGRPWIIENVPSSGLEGMTLCGSMFGLKNLRRHRRFASSELLTPPRCRHDLDRQIIGVYGSGGPKNPGGRGRRYKNRAEALEVMGLPSESRWTRREITESIPPAYTEFIMNQMLDRGLMSA